MAPIDLTQGRWRLHRHYGPVDEKQMATLAEHTEPSGTNTDVLLQFTAQPSELNAGAPASLQVTWYHGTIEANDPKHDSQDKIEVLGEFWAKVFSPAIDGAQYSIQLIQENWPPPNTSSPSIAKTVRMFVGKCRSVTPVKFFGYGADNWGTEINTFTLTYEVWPPRRS